MRTRIIDLQLYRRPLAGRRAHAEGAADRFRPLAHRDQAQMPPRLRALRVEPGAVVRDGDDEERGRVRGERDAEERLVDSVVEVARQAVPLLDTGELAAPLVEARVLD